MRDRPPSSVLDAMKIVTAFVTTPRPDLAAADPWTFYAEAARTVRGGLPARSFGEGRRGAEMPAPKLDPTDRAVLAAAKKYEQKWSELARTCAELVRIQNAMSRVMSIEDASRLAVAERGPDASECRSCASPISGVGNDRPRAGQCEACYRAGRRAQTVDTNTRSVVT